jgi:hypothetical protein
LVTISGATPDKVQPDDRAQDIIGTKFDNKSLNTSSASGHSRSFAVLRRRLPLGRTVGPTADRGFDVGLGGPR